MKKSKAERGLLIKIGKIKSLLWECYTVMKDITGTEEDDFLSGEEGTIKIVEPATTDKISEKMFISTFNEKELIDLKRKLRRYFWKKQYSTAIKS